MKRVPIQWILIAVGIAFTLAVPSLLRGQQYWLFIATQAFFWAMLASSWALLAGYASLLWPSRPMPAASWGEI